MLNHMIEESKLIDYFHKKNWTKKKPSSMLRTEIGDFLVNQKVKRMVVICSFICLQIRNLQLAGSLQTTKLDNHAQLDAVCITDRFISTRGIQHNASSGCSSKTLAFNQYFPRPHRT